MTSELLPRVEELSPRSRRLHDVIELGRLDRRFLGFLPDQGFSERADNGTLLVAVAGGATAGYVLYDLPGNWITLRHLCVAQSYRGLGVATALVNEVRARHPDRAGIELACRPDFPADAIWPKLDFRPVGYRRGRSRTGHELKIWLDDFEQPNLFTDAALSAVAVRDIAVIDHNVFEDLVTDRPEGEESRALEEDWVGELIEVCITAEVNLEIDKCQDSALRRQMQHDAQLFRVLRDPGWRELVSDFTTAVPRAGGADQNHLARALAAGATYFVTRDDEVLEAAKRVEAAFDLIPIRPWDLIVRLDLLRSRGRYEPALLHGTAIRSAGLDGVDEADLVRNFVNHAAGERAASFKKIIRGALADPGGRRTRVFETATGELLGILMLKPERDAVEVPLIRVVAGDRLAPAVARQLAFLPREAAASEGARAVRITDPKPSPAVLRALPEEAYVERGGVPTCEVGRGIKTADKTQSNQWSAAAEERRRWPERSIGAGMKTFMVPIHPWWASQLFDANLAAETLEGRGIALGLSREHIYYRSTHASGGIAAPARILWYVKGGTAAHRVGALRAVSLLDEVVIGRADTLFRRFERLGIWTRQQVRERADAKHRVMALRFTDTELFERPLYLDELRRLYAGADARFSAPRGPQPATERTFCLIYKQASAYAN